MAVYYAVARAAGQSRTPWLAAIGRFLLGGVARKPVYMSSLSDADHYGD